MYEITNVTLSLLLLILLDTDYVEFRDVDVVSNIYMLYEKLGFLGGGGCF